MKNRPVRILAIPGSLRTASYNRMLLEAARRLAPSPVEVNIYEDGLHIPLFNEDTEGDLTPESVLELRRRIRSVDAVLIASPEYNGSITGVLKNLIDWASRPYGQSAFADKPVSHPLWWAQARPASELYGLRKPRSRSSPALTRGL